MARFRTVDISRVCNRRSLPRSRRKGGVWGAQMDRWASEIPFGLESSWGIPFKRPARKSGIGLIELSRRKRSVSVPVSGKADYVCILHFCDALRDRDLNPDCGKVLADYVLAYGDGSTHTQPIRRRFEVHACNVGMRRWPYAAVDSYMSGPVIGSTRAGIRAKPTRGSVWLYAMPNPCPEKPLRSIELLLTGDDPLAILGITLFRGRAHPLRHLPRRHFKLLLPPGKGARPKEVQTDLDMGHITDVRAVPAWQPDNWTKSAHRGLGEADRSQARTRRLLLEMTGAEDAELTVKARGVGRKAISYGDAFENGNAKSPDGSVRLHRPADADAHPLPRAERGVPPAARTPRGRQHHVW